MPDPDRDDTLEETEAAQAEGEVAGETTSDGAREADDAIDADADRAGDDDATDDDADVIFDTLWGRVVEAWDDDKTHGALLEYALRKEHLPQAAGRYRALTGDPAKKERAQKQLDAIVMAATQLMLSMKTPPPPKTPRWMNLVAAIVCIVLLVWLAYVVLGRGG